VPLILETIVTTQGPDGTLHLVPFGLIQEGEDYVLAPFRPSPTILNLERSPYLAAAAPADIRVIAGCVTGRRDWPTVPCTRIPGRRLADAYGHRELEVVETRDDPVRPRFHCRVVHEEAHRAFTGYNRARAAVLEAAILSTRLHMLAPDKVAAEMRYLHIAVAKTAGAAEREAWSWVEDKVAAALGWGEAERLPAPGDP
jgi:hypothetical protein